jgi:hypothetical protein
MFHTSHFAGSVRMHMNITMYIIGSIAAPPERASRNKAQLVLALVKGQYR